MLERLGEFVFRRAKTVLVVAAVAFVAAALLGLGAFGKLKGEGFDDPASDSSKAARLLDKHFTDQTNLVIDVRAKDGTADSPAVAEAGRRITESLSTEKGFSNTVSYWTTGAPSLKTADGTGALIVTHAEDDVSELPERTAALVKDAPVTVKLGGGNALGPEINAQVGKSLAIAEAIAVPLTLILLVLAFGSFVAALIPLAIGFVAIIGTFAELFVLGSLTDVSIFSINLTTALGLGLAIDYALLIVARHRELRHNGLDPHDAVIGTVRTAGKTILFSAATVAAALAVLLVFPMYFLRSFAYAGIGVVVISAAAALFIAPALLTVLGPRAEGNRSRGVQGAEAPLWTKLGTFVGRRPLLTALPVLAVLLVAASPLLGVKFGTPDERVLPADTAVRQVGEALRQDYPADNTEAIDVVATGPAATQPLTSYAIELSKVPGVVRVDSATGSFTGGQPAPGAPEPGRTRPGAQLITVTGSFESHSDKAQDLIHKLRDVDAPEDATAYIGGRDADLIDTKNAIGSRIPLAIGLIALTTFVVLFLFTGSVVQPLRALVSNGLSIAAAMGVTVWVFQDGHFADFLGFTPLPMDTSMTVLLFCVAFGLSMDYEVFVISRIKELHDAGEPEAVTKGLARTGRIVTTAAALLAVTFVAFMTSSVSFLQLFGLGAALAILIDATLVRGVLVPASMRLLGRWAWYAPKGMRRLHDRVGVSE